MITTPALPYAIFSCGVLFGFLLITLLQIITILLLSHVLSRMTSNTISSPAETKRASIDIDSLDSGSDGDLGVLRTPDYFLTPTTSEFDRAVDNNWSALMAELDRRARSSEVEAKPNDPIHHAQDTTNGAASVNTSHEEPANTAGASKTSHKSAITGTPFTLDDLAYSTIASRRKAYHRDLALAILERPTSPVNPPRTNGRSSPIITPPTTPKSAAPTTPTPAAPTTPFPPTDILSDTRSRNPYTDTPAASTTLPPAFVFSANPQVQTPSTDASKAQAKSKPRITVSKRWANRSTSDTRLPPPPPSPLTAQAIPWPPTFITSPSSRNPHSDIPPPAPTTPDPPPSPLSIPRGYNKYADTPSFETLIQPAGMNKTQHHLTELQRRRHGIIIPKEVLDWSDSKLQFVFTNPRAVPAVGLGILGALAFERGDEVPVSPLMDGLLGEIKGDENGQGMGIWREGWEIGRVDSGVGGCSGYGKEAEVSPRTRGREVEVDEVDDLGVFMVDAVAEEERKKCVLRRVVEKMRDLGGRYK